MGWSEGVFSRTCDGKHFYLIVVKKEGESYSKFWDRLDWERDHSQRVYDEQYWLAKWDLAGLKEGTTNYPSSMVYLGKYSVDERTGAKSGYNLEQAHVAEGGDALLMPSLKIAAPGVLKPVPAMDELDEYRGVYTQSGNYLFKWKPSPGIYGALDPAFYKKIPETESFKRFAAAYDRYARHSSILTDDLRYLVGVPHNGGDSPQGWNHYRAYVYDLVSDKFSDITLQYGDKDTIISAAENVGGRLLFIAYAGTAKLGLLDENSTVLAELPAEGSFYANFRIGSYWDHSNNRIFNYNEISSIINDAPSRSVTLREYDYARKIGRTLTLNTGVPPEPL